MPHSDIRSFTLRTGDMTLGDLLAYAEHARDAGVPLTEKVVAAGRTTLFSPPDRLEIHMAADKLPAVVPTPGAEQ